MTGNSWQPILATGEGCSKGQVVNVFNTLLDSILTDTSTIDTGTHSELQTITDGNGVGATVNVIAGGSVDQTPNGLMSSITTDTSSLNIGSFDSLATTCILNTGVVCGEGAILTIINTGTCSDNGLIDETACLEVGTCADSSSVVGNGGNYTTQAACEYYY